MYRPVVPGCAGCAMADPDFGRSVNPISTRGDRLCPPNYYWHTRIFRPSDGPAGAKYALHVQWLKYIIGVHIFIYFRYIHSHVSSIQIRQNVCGREDWVSPYFGRLAWLAWSDNWLTPQDFKYLCKYSPPLPPSDFKTSYSPVSDLYDVLH